MKKTTQRIIGKFQMLEEILIDFENSEGALRELDEIEAAFLSLARFFETPGKESFDLGTLYRYLDNDWLEFALELITDFFREETYLIQKPTYSLIKDGSDYYSLTQFAEELSKRGLRYDRQKLNLYFERGKVPQPDLVVGGVKYWSKKTVDLYSDTEKTRMKRL